MGRSSSRRQLVLCRGAMRPRPRPSQWRLGMAPFLDAKSLKAALTEGEFNERVILALFAAIGTLTARLLCTVQRHAHLRAIWALAAPLVRPGACFWPR